MCGIAGFAGRHDPGLLEEMTGRIAHRGPDAAGHWCDPETRVALGHRRLSILDLSGGAQPMWTPDSQLGVVFNGEIYNHVELRAELISRGAIFQTAHSDTEVLLHAYRQWGDSFVERLNGMWAFVLYDRQRQRLFGSRDRFGKKPLFYFQQGDQFGFASELSALRAHPDCPTSLSELALRKYFAYGYVPTRESVNCQAATPSPSTLSVSVSRSGRTGSFNSNLTPVSRNPTASRRSVKNSAPHFKTLFTGVSCRMCHSACF
jgi:asparagine synthase (glutamine-hydrolysing)